MTRVSQEELYNDKDVITQILKLKDTVNGYAGGIIENIDISGNNLVIDWEDGTSISLPLPDPVTGISSVTGNVSGGNLTITFYFSNGTTHSFTCPLAGMASEAYVDAKDAQNVKLTGDQSIDGIKSFNTSPIVPDTPNGFTSAVNVNYVDNSVYMDDTVNNIVHKDGYEKITGVKVNTQPLYLQRENVENAVAPAANSYQAVIFNDKNGVALFYVNTCVYNNGDRSIALEIPTDANGSSAGLALYLFGSSTLHLDLTKNVGGVATAQTIATL